MLFITQPHCLQLQLYSSKVCKNCLTLILLMQHTTKRSTEPQLATTLATEQIAIEKVQHCITRLLKPLLNLTYQEHLSHLKLPSLQYRRLRGDMIYMYQIFHHLMNVNSSLLFLSPHLSSTREHNYKVYKPYAM